MGGGVKLFYFIDFWWKSSGGSWIGVIFLKDCLRGVDYGDRNYLLSKGKIIVRWLKMGIF